MFILNKLPLSEDKGFRVRGIRERKNVCACAPMSLLWGRLNHLRKVFWEFEGLITEISLPKF